MSLALASLAVQAGNSYNVNVGSTSTVGAVVVLNESPYGLNVSNGSSSQWIAAQTADLVPCDAMGFNGMLTIRTDSYLDNASTAPSFLVYFTAFAPGEAIRGTYPSPLARMSNVGNIVTTNATTPNSLEQDIITPFVLSGLTAAKDGATANRLDVASGVALVRQPDSSIGRVAPSATNFTTAQINSTYYLFLNPDGTYSWQLSSTGQTNSLAIAHATTDASGNISAVTDDRVLSTELFAGMDPAHNVELAGGLSYGGGTGVASMPSLSYNSAANLVDMWTPQSGAAQSFTFIAWDGGAPVYPLALGPNNPVPAAASIDSAGHLMCSSAALSSGGQFQVNASGAVTFVGNQATAGSFGVPVIVAQLVAHHVTTTGLAVLLNFTAPVTGMYRLNLMASVGANAGTIEARISYFDGSPLALGNSHEWFTWAGNPNTLLNGATSISNQAIATFPLTAYCLANNQVAISYNNSNATPNDYVSAWIERIS